jgi:hypothetical protein
MVDDDVMTTIQPSKKMAKKKSILNDNTVAGSTPY